MKCGFSIILLAAAVLQCKAVDVSLGEIDYRSREDGGVTVDVVKAGENFGDLKLIITPMSEAQFRSNGLTLPAEKFNSEFLSAERATFEADGRQDFNNSEQTITFAPSNENDEQAVFIPFKDDAINEAMEVFYVVVRADSDTLDDRDSVEYIRNGIALAVIDDNDPIKLTFQEETYTVMEEDAVHNDLVRIVKENGVLSEQTLQVLVQLNPPAGSAADSGVDFDLEFNTSVPFVLTPDDQSVGVPFSLQNDLIAEEIEHFTIFLTVPENTPTFSPGTFSRTSVFITDDESAEVGFEQDEYTVSEGDGSVEVCVRILSPDEADIFIFLLASTVEGTATAIDDYTSRSDVGIEIADATSRICFNIPITDDETAESVETFGVMLVEEELPENVVITRPVTTVVIQDDDNTPDDPTCDRNARLLETGCVCNPGYFGNGLTCSDINECATGANNCNANARCINTPGSYRCECRQGYTGNGFICRENINECATGANNCHTNARCINTPGSYRCQCRQGYTGNGFMCRDINECRERTHNCGTNAWCTNTVGSFRCTCGSGYSGNGLVCLDINECVMGTDNCHRDARCINTPGSFGCRCRLGFTGNGRVCNSNRPNPPSPPMRNPIVRPTIPPRPVPVSDDCDNTGTRRSRTRTRTRSRCDGTPRSRSTRRSRSRSTRRSRSRSTR